MLLYIFPRFQLRVLGVLKLAQLLYTKLIRCMNNEQRPSAERMQKPKAVRIETETGMIHGSLLSSEKSQRTISVTGLFNYMCGFLFEEVFEGNTEDIHMLFDDRTVKVTTQHNLQNYLRLRIEKEQYPFKLTQLSYNDSKHIRLIQLADSTLTPSFNVINTGRLICTTKLMLAPQCVFLASTLVSR